MGRILQRNRTLLIACAAGLGGVFPDIGHGLNLITQGKVDWGYFHNCGSLFFWLLITSVGGLLAGQVWGRVVLGKSK